MKKILLFTRPLNPPWDEASKNLAYEIATKSQRENLAFDVFSSSNSPEAEKFKTEKIHQRKIYKKNQFDAVEKFRLITSFLFTKIKADIVHFLFTPRPLTSFIIKFRLLFSKTKTIQTIATISKKHLQNKKRLRKILFADTIVAQSDYTFKKIKKQGFQNLELIYPGVDLKKFHPGEKNPALLKENGIKKNDFVVLFAGEYTRLKAIDDIMQAFQKIYREKSNQDVKLILACRIKSPQDKIKKEQIIELSKKQGFFKQIIFKETVENMADLYRLSDLNIFPVREMTGKFDIPLALVEAMACKKPVIVSDIKVLQEFIGDEKTGIITPKANPAKLKENILNVKNNKLLRKKISEIGFDFAKENFDIEKNIKKYHQLYQNFNK
ncbi:MAG: glycosyltransferase family 4 protein [Candidatus Moraniibacteriota bacterium]